MVYVMMEEQESIYYYYYLYSGKCTCERGWDEPNCNKCKSQYFGVQCQACSIDCHGRGSCNISFFVYY